MDESIYHLEVATFLIFFFNIPGKLSEAEAALITSPWIKSYSKKLFLTFNIIDCWKYVSIQSYKSLKNIPHDPKRTLLLPFPIVKNCWFFTFLTVPQYLLLTSSFLNHSVRQTQLFLINFLRKFLATPIFCFIFFMIIFF